MLSNFPERPSFVFWSWGEFATSWFHPLKGTHWGLHGEAEKRTQNVLISLDLTRPVRKPLLYRMPQKTLRSKMLNHIIQSLLYGSCCAMKGSLEHSSRDQNVSGALGGAVHSPLPGRAEGNVSEISQRQLVLKLHTLLPPTYGYGLPILLFCRDVEGRCTRTFHSAVGSSQQNVISHFQISFTLININRVFLLAWLSFKKNQRHCFSTFSNPTLCNALLPYFLCILNRAKKLSWGFTFYGLYVRLSQ